MKDSYFSSASKAFLIDWCSRAWLLQSWNGLSK